MKILLIDKGNTFDLFAASLAQKAEVIRCQSGREAMLIAEREELAAVCVNSELTDSSGMDFVHDFARIHPLTNCALQSGLSAEDFHEATEGLGLVMQIGEMPGAGEADRLLEILSAIDKLF